MSIEIFGDYFLNTDVLCLECYGEYLLAGIGNDLFIYKCRELLFRRKIFDGERVHCIYIFENCIILKGCKEVAFATLTVNSGKIEFHIQSRLTCNDWIQDIFYDVNKNYLALATAHNGIEMWDMENIDCTDHFKCEEKCILYSGRFVGESIDEIVLLGGTVFSKVIIWAPSTHSTADQRVIHKLEGHDGVIFSITVDLLKNVICTTSDDRSIRIWSVVADGSLSRRKNWESASITLSHTLYGHTARVWKSVVLPDCIVSGGEDSKICVWDRMGKLQNSLVLHQESGIRGLTVSGSGEVVTGGEDGGISCLTIGELHRRTPLGSTRLVSHRVDNVLGSPRRVAFGKKDICLTDRGIVLCPEGSDMSTVIYKNEYFSNYCVLEVSACKDYLMLGSITGRVTVVQVLPAAELFDGDLINGRVHAIHWLKDRVVCCGPDGRVFAYTVSLSPFELVKDREMILPISKERWTTCALVHGGYILLGDRMGGLHVYRARAPGGEPHQSFPRIHGHLGVTDVVAHGGDVLTAGRDGTVRRFHLSESGLTHSIAVKLPMEWAWKIAVHGRETFVLGFGSRFFTVWSLDRREVLARYDCGGGHRSVDFDFTGNDRLTLLYIKNKEVFRAEISWSSPRHYRDGFHGREINCLKVLQTDPLVTVSGGEDTTLRISRFSKSRRESLHMLENHISSVRDVTFHSTSRSDRIMFSVGGRAQICAHEFNVDTLRYRALGDVRLQASTKTAREPSDEGETRVMCVDCVEVSGEILVCVGCSDCKIRIFSYRSDLVLLTVVPYTHCILKVKCVQMESLVAVASMGTDGRITFWDVTGVASTGREARRLLSVKIHQSGVNGFALEKLPDGRMVLATGGDDNLLSVLLLEFSSDSEEGFGVVNQWTNSGAHSCQITGMKFAGDLLLTASIDQRLTVWRWSVGERAVRVTYLSQYLSTIADVQGMETSLADRGSILVFLHGKGLEIVEIDPSKLPGGYPDAAE